MQSQELSVLNFQQLFGYDSYPHGDTLADLCVRVQVEEVQARVVWMLRMLVRKRVLEHFRLYGYYVIAIDGTGTLSFGERDTVSTVCI